MLMLRSADKHYGGGRIAVCFRIGAFFSPTAAKRANLKSKCKTTVRVDIFMIV
jgi:hypothetical protein